MMAPATKLGTKVRNSSPDQLAFMASQTRPSLKPSPSCLLMAMRTLHSAMSMAAKMLAAMLASHPIRGTHPTHTPTKPATSPNTRLITK